MSQYSVTPEGVEALKRCSAALQQGLESVKTAGTALTSLASENQKLGPHAKEVEEIMKDIQTFTKEAESPVDRLSTGLNNLAKSYTDIIADQITAGKK